jgi:hypothetical protein
MRQSSDLRVVTTLNNTVDDEDAQKRKNAFLYHFDADSRKQGMRQRSDLRVVTALNNTVDDADAQNGKEKSGGSFESCPLLFLHYTEHP